MSEKTGMESQAPKNNSESPLLWAMFQVTYLAVPVLLLAFALVIFHGSAHGLWHKADLAFLALIFGTESLRDAFELDRLRGLGNIAAESAVIYLILLLLIAAAPLFLIIGVEAGKVSIPIEEIAPWSVFSFFFNGFVCLVVKWALKTKRNAQVPH